MMRPSKQGMITNLLIRLMKENDAPAEQYRRSGLMLSKIAQHRPVRASKSPGKYIRIACRDAGVSETG